MPHVERREVANEGGLMVRNGFLEFQDLEDSAILQPPRRQRAFTDSAIDSGVFGSPALKPSALPARAPLERLQEPLGSESGRFQLISEVSTETTGSERGDSVPAASPRPAPSSSSSSSSNDGRAVVEEVPASGADPLGFSGTLFVPTCPADSCAELGDDVPPFEAPTPSWQEGNAQVPVGKSILGELFQCGGGTQEGGCAPPPGGWRSTSSERRLRPGSFIQQREARYFHDGPPPPLPKGQEPAPAQAEGGRPSQDEQPQQPWREEQWQWYGPFQPYVQWIPIIGEQVQVGNAPPGFPQGSEQWQCGHGAEQWQAPEQYWQVVPVQVAAQPSADNHGRTASRNDRASAHAEGASCADAERTTVMLRNLPTQYDRSMLMQLLDDEGFAGLYDFVYLPMDFRGSVCFGYGFINFANPQAAECFRQQLNGFSRWSVDSDKIAEVSWSEPLQGLEHHIERYRNSPLMHESVLDMYKPVLLSGGIRTAFPPPTKKLRAPRVRNAKGIADA